MWNALVLARAIVAIFLTMAWFWIFGENDTRFTTLPGTSPTFHYKPSWHTDIRFNIMSVSNIPSKFAKQILVISILWKEMIYKSLVSQHSIGSNETYRESSLFIILLSTTTLGQTETANSFRVELSPVICTYGRSVNITYWSPGSWIFWVI